MGKAKKIIIGAAALIAAAAVCIVLTQVFSVCEVNTRELKKALRGTINETKNQGEVKDLIPFDYDMLYVFAPYQSVGEMERIIGFSDKRLGSSMSESHINYLFVKDKKAAAYFVGSPEALGFCINLAPGEYEKAELDGMSYKAETRRAGSSYGEEKTYQDFNFYFKEEIIETEGSAVIEGGMKTKVSVEEEISIDINGGEEETICYSVKNNELMINGSDCMDSVTKLGVTMENPKTDVYYILDLDTEDNYKEIALLDEKEEEEVCVYYFRYIKGKLRYIGSSSNFLGLES